jgi:hypothetical protein
MKHLVINPAETSGGPILADRHYPAIPSQPDQLDW